MFSKNTIPQRKPFQLTTQQIKEDIEAVSSDEEQRNKLYLCLDEKPPQEDIFSKVEEFLKGSDELENIVQKIEVAKQLLEETTEEIKQKAEEIRQKAESYKKLVEKSK